MVASDMPFHAIPPPIPPPATREQDGIEARARLYTDARLEALQRDSATSLKIKLGVATAAIMTVGAIVTAGITWVGANNEAAAEAASRNETAKSLAGIQRQLNEIYGYLERIDKRAREDRSELEAKIAARPLGVVRATPPRTPKPPAVEPEGTERPAYDPGI